MRRTLRALDLPDPVIGLAITLGALLALATPLVWAAPAGALQHPQRIPFGLPFTWLTQNQAVSGLPPSTQLINPMDASESVRLLPLLADVACWIVLLLLVAVVVQLAVRGVRRSLAHTRVASA